MIYKLVPGHRQYQVSECGKSIQRIEGGKKPFRELSQTFHVVKGKECPNGYNYATLMTKDCINMLGELVDIGTNTHTPVHRLVALAHIPNPNNLPEVDHEDNNKLNNHYTNLKWVTHAHNIQASYDRGRNTYKGDNHWLTGKKWSKSIKIKQSIAKIGMSHPKYKGYYLINGSIFHSLRQAELITKIDRRTIKKYSNDANNKDFAFVPVIKPNF